VDGFRTMAERRTRPRFMQRVHKPAMKTLSGAQVGSTLAAAIEDVLRFVT